LIRERVYRLKRSLDKNNEISNNKQIVTNKLTII